MVAEYHVYGSPGTGKTKALERQVQQAIDKGRDPDKIVIASFTRAAATTVRERVPSVPERNVGTIHSLARSCIQSTQKIAEDKFSDFNRFCRGRPEYDGLQVSEATNKSARAPSAVFEDASLGDQLFTDMMLARSRMEGISQTAHSGALARFNEAWEIWKEESDLIDFTDMLELALQSGIIPADCQDLFIDEAQDMDKLQATLVRKWARNAKNLVLFGDDDQTIYSWNGASVDNFLGHQSVKDIVLPQSYRLPAAVHEKAVRFIERAIRPGHRKAKEFRPRDAKGFSSRINAPIQAYPMAALKAARHHAEAGQTVMILTSCSFMLKPILRLMKDEGVAFFNPYRLEEGLWNPMRFSGTSSAHRVWCFLKGFDESGMMETGPSWTGGQISMWIELLSKDVFSRGVSKKNIKAMVEEVPAKVFDITQWRAWLTEDPFQEMGTGDFEMAGRWLIRNAIASKQGPLAYPVRVASERGLRGLTERPRIIPGTIHSVKGAEADIVILAPDISAKAAASAVPGQPMEDLARLFYVGMTRAKKGLYVTAPPVATRGPYRAMGGLY